MVATQSVGAGGRGARPTGRARAPGRGPAGRAPGADSTSASSARKFRYDIGSASMTSTVDSPGTTSTSPIRRRPAIVRRPSATCAGSVSGTSIR